MRGLKKALQAAVVCAVLVPAGVMVSSSAALASGCPGSYTDGGRSYTTGPCTGYPSYFHQEAKATCLPEGSGSSFAVYGSRVSITSKSRALCPVGYYASHGTAIVYDN